MLVEYEVLNCPVVRTAVGIRYRRGAPASVPGRPEVGAEEVWRAWPRTALKLPEALSITVATGTTCPAPESTFTPTQPPEVSEGARSALLICTLPSDGTSFVIVFRSAPSCPFTLTCTVAGAPDVSARIRFERFRASESIPTTTSSGSPSATPEPKETAGISVPNREAGSPPFTESVVERYESAPTAEERTSMFAEMPSGAEKTVVIRSDVRKSPCGGTVTEVFRMPPVPVTPSTPSTVQKKSAFTGLELKFLNQPSDVKTCVASIPETDFVAVATMKDVPLGGGAELRRPKPETNARASTSSTSMTAASARGSPPNGVSRRFVRKRFEPSSGERRERSTESVSVTCPEAGTSEPTSEEI